MTGMFAQLAITTGQKEVHASIAVIVKVAPMPVMNAQSTTTTSAGND